MSDLTLTVDGIDIEVTLGRFGLCYATSRRIPGLRVVEARIERLPQAVRQAIVDIKAARCSRFGFNL